MLPIGVPSGRRLRGEQTVQRGRGVHESLPPARRVRVQRAMQGGQQEGAVLLSARPLWKPSDQLQERRGRVFKKALWRERQVQGNAERI